ncbi:ABC transporter [Paramagnetospirillum marisnigri]|uniref:ABC transporter n=1 Tax=Paramagnetospirillum marisnigri TaxID=1285242 RepID=A0A178MS35_9PROT|nr:ABC-type transport auxiliary lipoprotein family protein [Paramagnetospirillum marisnigri]OAN52421.1 ABC transporter [Paramagnetospirillum marisnigri]
MRKTICSLILLLALAACAGPAAPPDNFHRVEPADSGLRFARPALPGVLEIDRLATDGTLAERAVTFAARDGGPLSHYKYDYWSEAPALMLQDRLSVALTRAGAADRVVTPDLRVLSDWMLRGKLRRFEQLAASSRAAVDIQLAIVSSRDGSLVLLQDYSAEVATESERVESLPAAMDKALTDIFARFLADLGRARGNAPVAR